MKGLLTPFKICWQAVRLWLDELAGNILLNLVWLLCWLTLVLGPPATFSLIQVSHIFVDGYYPTRADFLTGIKRYFTKSWQWMLANLVMLALFVANLLFYGSIQASWSRYVQGLFLGLLVLWLGVQFYALPYLIIQEDKSLRIAWRNALLTLLASPGYSLVLGIFVLFVIFLSIFTVLLALLGAGTLLAILANLAVQERLEKFAIPTSHSNGDKPINTQKNQAEE